MNDDPRNQEAAVYRRAPAGRHAPNEEAPSKALDAQRETVRLEAMYNNLIVIDPPAREENEQ